MTDLLNPLDRARINSWYSRRDFVTIGNLGEQVAARLLIDWGYQVLATQDDLRGGVANILARPASENPEDFVVIDPEGRLLTVNSKATVSPRTSRLTAEGDLKAPHLGKQGIVDYYSLRAGLISPLDDAQTHGQVIKVDLLHLRAQLFEIRDDGSAIAIRIPAEIGSVVEDILMQHQARVPPPRLDGL